MRRLAALFLCLAVLGCFESGPISGIVLSKRAQPEYTSLMPIVNCHPVGKVTICTTTMIPIHHDPAWYVVIRDNDEKQHEREVTPALYEAVAVGQWVTLT